MAGHGSMANCVTRFTTIQNVYTLISITKLIYLRMLQKAKVVHGCKAYFWTLPDLSDHSTLSLSHTITLKKANLEMEEAGCNMHYSALTATPLFS